MSGVVGLEKQLGEAIALARKSAGLTQQELCARTKLSYSTLAKIERGAIKSPSVFTVATIARATDTSVETLVGSAMTPKVQAKAYHKSKAGISYVFFDVNGVMVHFFQRAFTKLAEMYDVSPDIIESAFWHFNDDVCRGTMKIDDFNKYLEAQTGAKHIDWKSAYLDNISQVTDLQTIAAWVADYYKIGLMTNIMPGFVDAMLQRGILPKLQYDAIIESCNVGAVKPELAMYQAAAAAAGVDPENILLVDDDRSNLMAAERLGWHVLWFDDFSPHTSIERLKTLLDYKELSTKR